MCFVSIRHWTVRRCLSWRNMCVFWTRKLLCGIGKEFPCEKWNVKSSCCPSWETKLFLLLTFCSLKLPCLAFCLSKICNRYQNSVFLISFFANNLTLFGSCLSSSAMVATNVSLASSTFFLSFTLFKKISFCCFISLSFFLGNRLLHFCLHLPFLAF